MALTTNMKVWRILLVVFLLMTAVLSILFYFQSIFVTILIGIGLIFITNKLRLLYRRIFGGRMKSRTARVFCIFLFLVLSLVGIYFIINNAVTEIEQIIRVTRAGLSEESTLSDIYSERLQRFIPENIATLVFTKANIEKTKAYVVSELANIIPLLTGQILTAVLIVPLLFYIYFRRGHILMQEWYNLVPAKLSKVVRNTIQETKKDLDSYFTGKIVQSSVVAIICIIGFLIAGVKAPLFFGILAGFLNIIPFVGPLLGAIPPLFIALLDPSGSVALGVLITVVVAQLVDNLYLQPFMLASRVKMEPLLAILLVLIFANLAGALGMILAIPIYSVYKATLRELYGELVAVYGI